MKKREILGIIAIIIIQTVVFCFFGNQKVYLHMDESYSLGLASYDKVEIQDNEDFYDQWHESTYYEDYLSVDESEKFDYFPVYENQKNDVHPPLYYLFLRFFMGFSINHYSKWSGIILNILLSTFISVFTYLITKRLLNNDSKKALWITLLSSLLASSITNVIYIRMYCLATLNIVITTYLHFKLLDEKRINYKLLFFIGLSALCGSLTHYYYLFYLAFLFLMMTVKYIKEKEYKYLLAYVLTIGLAAICSLGIFPYSIKHMFFGYRGQGFIDKLMNIKAFSANILKYICKMSIFAFHNLLPLLVLVLLVGVLYYKFKKNPLPKNKYTKYILLPSLFYFLLVAGASPYIELRYILPVCGMVFIVLISYLTELFPRIFLYILTLGLIIAPIISNEINKNVSFDMKVEPEVLYKERREIVDLVHTDLNLPTLYLFNSECNRFLDDMLLFTILDHSYIAKDIDCNEENIQSIMINQDISKGVLVIINERQENDRLTEIVKNALNFTNITYITHLSNSDVYYIN